MKKYNPLITVYIPTYNRVELLQRAVNSVLSQTYQNLEIIIVDDCSTDATHDYLKEIASKESRIRYFLKEKNSGACVSRNIAIKNANGVFITGLDDDDYFRSDRLELFIEKWLVKSENTKILYSLYTRKTPTGISKPISDHNKINKLKKVRAKDLLYTFHIEAQIFTTKEIFINNLFDPNMIAWQDLECYYRLLKTYKCYAELVPEESYIIDTSHIHERISGQNIEKIESAYRFFKEKHKLSRKHSNLAYCQLIHYPNHRVNSIHILRRFLYKPSIIDLKRFVYLAIKPLV